MLLLIHIGSFIIVHHFPAGSASRPTIDQAQLERELELDIEKVRIEDNIDPNVRQHPLLVLVRKILCNNLKDTVVDIECVPIIFQKVTKCSKIHYRGVNDILTSL